MPNASEPRTPKPRLRWYQYRLRTLLIVMTLLAAWMAHISHRARQQKLAVEKVQALGGTVYFDYQKKNGGDYEGAGTCFDPQATTPGPAWLRNLIGDNYFQTVVFIDLSKTTATDNDMAVLAYLPNLEYLDLSETQITSEVLIHLTGLGKLISVSVSKTKINDRGIACLKNSTHLAELDLEGTDVSDEGIKQLPKIDGTLWLKHTRITDESLKYLANFKKLRFLNVCETQVTRMGVEKLQKDLPDTSISFDEPKL